MDTSAPITDLLQHFALRYQRALTVKAAWLGALSLAIAGALGWRLHALALPPAWRLGPPIAIGLAASAALRWWLSRRWLSASAGAAYLDERLGLQQRLVTAAEFAASPQPPPLYPLLVEDAARQCSPEQLRTPRPLDRTAALLLVILLLVLVWPVAGRSPLQQLAQLPKITPPTPTPTPPEPPTPPSPSSDQRAQQQQQPGGGGGGAQPQPSAGGPDQPSSPNQPSSGGSSGRDQAQRRPQDSRSPSRDPSGGGQSAQPQSADSNGQGQSQQTNTSSRQQQDQSGQSASQGGQQQQPSSSSKSDQQQGQPGQQQGQQGGQQQAQAAAGGSQSKPEQGQQEGAASSSSGSGQQLSAGEQEALKGDIQQLLKEVSGELKNLQEQLAAAQQGQPPPQAGSTTDPDLYGASEPLDPSKGEAVPIEVRPDTAPTKTPRPGGGTGEASRNVSTDGPRMGSEEAQLSDAPVDETSTGRQTVPPEYRNVFDRLNKTPH